MIFMLFAAGIAALSTFVVRTWQKKPRTMPGLRLFLLERSVDQ